MLSKTSVIALRLLVHLGLLGPGKRVPLRVVARELRVSPTYLIKIGRRLARAGILRASRGVGGGVSLDRAPADITLLAIVEACQGPTLGDFCRRTDDHRKVCGLHRAGAELHAAITGTLRRWTLKSLLRHAEPAAEMPDRKRCLLLGGSR